MVLAQARQVLLVVVDRVAEHAGNVERAEGGVLARSAPSPPRRAPDHGQRRAAEPSEPSQHAVQVQGPARPATGRARSTSSAVHRSWRGRAGGPGGRRSRPRRGDGRPARSSTRRRAGRAIARSRTAAATRSGKSRERSRAASSRVGDSLVATPRTPAWPGASARSTSTALNRYRWKPVMSAGGSATRRGDPLEQGVRPVEAAGRGRVARRSARSSRGIGACRLPRSAPQARAASAVRRHPARRRGRAASAPQRGARRATSRWPPDRSRAGSSCTARTRPCPGARPATGRRR